MGILPCHLFYRPVNEFVRYVGLVGASRYFSFLSIKLLSINLKTMPVKGSSGPMK